ncbi:MAG: hypothetical protein HY659_04300 [Rhizobiales bacterium]|nr:hypothetical protein [Hyphomicrobiales bacterium]
MHILIVIAVGLIALGIFVGAGALTGKTAGLKNAAGIFIWFWLAVAVVYGAFGVFQAGIPVVNEIAAFIPIYGVPGLAAWYLAYKYGADR